MTDELRHDRLNASIDVIISQGQPTATGDAEVDVLARLASGLRGLPASGFKAGLRAEFVPGSEARGMPGLLTRIRAAVSFDRGTGLAAAGGGCGLAAGACCVGGTIVNLLGFASAAAVSAFIEAWLPYFVSISLVMLVALFIWVLRREGSGGGMLTRSAIRAGAVVGSAYGVVFAATMALSMAMGLY
jgi:hypothetical protein